MFNFGAFISYIFAMIFSPGPNNIMSMASANKYGFKEAIKFILGVFTGFFTIMLLCSFFNYLLFSFIPKIKDIMGILGAAYMLYLAYKIMKGKRSTAEEKEGKQEREEGSTSKSMNLFYTGMTMQFINPKTIIFSITVISNFIFPHFNSNIALLGFSLLLAAVAAISTLTWAFCGTVFNKFLSRYERQFNLVMGILLIYSAAVISGLTKLLSI